MTDLVSQLADQIMALINAKPRSPTKAEIEDVVRPMCEALQVLRDASLLSSHVIYGKSPAAAAPPSAVVYINANGDLDLTTTDAKPDCTRAWSSAFVTDHMNYDAGRAKWEAQRDRYRRLAENDVPEPVVARLRRGRQMPQCPESYGAHAWRLTGYDAVGLFCAPGDAKDVSGGRHYSCLHCCGASKIT